MKIKGKDAYHGFFEKGEVHHHALLHQLTVHDFPAGNRTNQLGLREHGQDTLLNIPQHRFFCRIRKYRHQYAGHIQFAGFFPHLLHTILQFFNCIYRVWYLFHVCSLSYLPLISSGGLTPVPSLCPAKITSAILPWDPYAHGQSHKPTRKWAIPNDTPGRYP